MAAGRGGGTVAWMGPHAVTTELMRLVPHVYGAARAASRDEDAAADVTQRVLRAAAGERLLDRDLLVERAIRLGVTARPARGFAMMDRLDREAVALARLAGYSAADVAATLEVDLEEAKRRMLRGLRTAADVASAWV
jgi:DNA-directed RNA polymerase specialized sigma24 family protein